MENSNTVKRAFNANITGDENINSVVTGDVLLSYEREEVPSLMNPILPQVGLATIGGGSDTGKSSLLRQFAIHVVTGEKEFLGFQLDTKYKSVIYVSTEDDENAVSMLLNKQTKGRYKKEELKGLRYIFDSSNLIQKLEAELSKQPADCFIIDAFTDIYSGSMNATNEIRSFLNVYSNITKKYDCLGFFLHHTGKHTDNNAPSKKNLLGSQGFEAKMRLVIELRKDAKEKEMRHMCIVKGNYLRDEYKNDSYVLRFNEDMTFTNTNKRVPFGELVSYDQKADTRGFAQSRAVELHNQGKSVRQIQTVFEEEKIPFKKSAIGEMVKSVRPEESPSDLDTDSKNN